MTKVAKARYRGRQLSLLPESTLRNLGPEEELRYTGKLSGESAEDAVDTLLVMDEVYTQLSGLDDVKTQFPEDDFLDDVITSLKSIHRRVRGQNKIELQEAIEALETVAGTTARATEFAITELDDMVRKINDAT